MSNPPNIRLRGIRTPIPTGYALGRTSPGSGDTELIPLSAVGGLTTVPWTAITDAPTIPTKLSQLTGDVLVTEGSGINGYTLNWNNAASKWEAVAPIVAPTGANPTATGADTAVNGSATTFMRSDAAPAIQKATSSVFGLVKVDGSTITASGGVITAVGATGADPTATAADAAVNGSATTFMRSDAAPAVQKATSSVFGLVKVDGSTITASGGVITAVGGGGGLCLPLVNGDGGGAGLVQDAVGQCIGVPL